MWATFGEFASKHGYGIWNNYDCSAFNEPLVDISTGPGGQLNKAFLANRGIDIATLAAGIAPTIPRSGVVANTPESRPTTASADKSMIHTAEKPKSGSEEGVYATSRANSGAVLAESGGVGRPKRRPGLKRVGKVGLDRPAWE